MATTGNRTVAGLWTPDGFARRNRPLVRGAHGGTGAGFATYERLDAAAGYVRGQGQPLRARRVAGDEEGGDRGVSARGHAQPLRRTQERDEGRERGGLSHGALLRAIPTDGDAAGAS